MRTHTISNLLYAMGLGCGLLGLIVETLLQLGGI